MTTQQVALVRVSLVFGVLILGLFALLAWMDGENDVAGTDLLLTICGAFILATWRP